MVKGIFETKMRTFCDNLKWNFVNLEKAVVHNGADMMSEFNFLK